MSCARISANRAHIVLALLVLVATTPGAARAHPVADGLPVAAQAAEPQPSRSAGRGKGRDRLALSLGIWDVDDPGDGLELGADYEFHEWRYHLLPHVGLHVAERGVVYAYAGVRYQWRLGARVTAVPSFAAALYQRGDAPKDLGYVLEFRSGIDFLVSLPNSGRVGFGFYHLSNGGLSSRNPGANSLLLRYRF